MADKLITEQRFYELLKRGEKDFKQCAFDNVNFSKVSLNGCDFSGSNFKNCKFIASQYVNSNFQKATFLASEFENVEFEKSDFYKTRFGAEQAQDASKFQGVTFSDCEMESCDMRHVILRKHGVFNSACIESDYSQAEFEDLVFSNSDLNRSNMTRLRGKDLFATNTNFDAVNFSGASLPNAELTLNTSLLEANFNQAELSGVRCAQSDISLAKFKGATLKDCAFTNVQLIQADFTKAVLQAVRFDESTDLKTINFSGATLKGVFSGQKEIQHVSESEQATPEKVTEKNVKVTEKKTQEPAVSPSETQKKLSGSIVKKMKVMQGEGKPMRIYPNGQVFIDADHLKYFKRYELQELDTYFKTKAEQTFKRDPTVTSLPEKLQRKLEILKEGGGSLSIEPNGRVSLPIMQIQYYTFDDISTLNSYWMNQAAEGKEVATTTQNQIKLPPTVEDITGKRLTQYPFTEKLNMKLNLLEQKGVPMHIYPNGQVLIDPSHQRYFKIDELRQLNSYYGLKVGSKFKKDPSVTTLPKRLTDKLKIMEEMSGQKICVSKTGRVTLPPQALKSFNDEEISNLNSYFMNQVEKMVTQQAPKVAPVPLEP